MTGRHSRRMRKSRSRLPAVPGSHESMTDDFGLLGQIANQYSSVIRTMPVKDMGSPANNRRGKFVAEKTAEILARGLQAIFDPEVVKILDRAVKEGSIEIEHSCKFHELLLGFVSACLIGGLDSYLKELETSVSRFEDSSITSIGFGPDEIEILRKLAPEFSGTIEELFETCRALSA